MGAITTTSSSYPQYTASEHHLSRCTICSHELKDDIDLDYVNWRNPVEIAKHYGVSYDALRRHVRATGLKEQKDINIKAYCLRVMKMKPSSKPKVGDQIEAAKLVAKLTHQLDPETQVAVQVNNNFIDMDDDQLQEYVNARITRLKIDKTD